MKKFFFILGTVIFLFVAVLIIIPILFKPQLVNLVKKEANKEINATFDFEDIGLNLFENFPDFTLAINRLSIVNQPPFSGDTLLQADNFKVTINLKSLIWEDVIQVGSVNLVSPKIKLIALKDGKVNWAVAKTSVKQETKLDQKEEKKFHVALKNYEINNAMVHFANQENGMEVLISQLNHNGTGDFRQDLFQLRTNTGIKELTVALAGIPYLNRSKVHIKADIDVDGNDKKYTLLENELQLNELLLGFNGYAKQNKNNTEVDLNFNATKTDFKHFLSLIPRIYAANFKELQAQGQIQVNGFVKGIYHGENFPTFQIKTSVSNGTFRYPELPSQVNNVSLELEIDHSEGILDKTSIHLKKLHAEIDREPIDIFVQIKTPISDPALSASLKGTINLEQAKNLFPRQQPLDVTGIIHSEIDFSGSLSDIKKNRLSKIQASGNLEVSNINYIDPKLPVEIQIASANLAFTPERVLLTNFQSKIGEGDIEADGSISNVLPFILNQELLKGVLNVNSNYFNLNPFIEGPSQQLQAVEIPGQIEFTLNSRFNEILLGKLKISNVSGYLLVKDKILHLMDLNMNLLNGSVVANGTYGKQKDQFAHMLFNLNAKNFSVNRVFDTFLTVQRFVPIAKNINGNFGAKLEIVTALDSILMPDIKSLNSRGELSIGYATISDFKPLTFAADMLKMDQLRNLVVENVKPSYRIRDGRFFINPVNFKFKNIDFLVSGSNGIDKSIDYQWKLKIPVKEFQSETNAKINQIFNRKLDLVQDDAVIVDLFFKGTMDNPDIKISGNNIVKSATQKLTDIAKQEIEEKKTILADTVRAELEKQKLELEKLKKKAEEKTQAEKEWLKKEAESKIKNLLKKKKN